MAIRKRLAFPIAEYRERLRRVRVAMAEQRLDGLLVHTPENICYLTGYHTTGYYMFQMLIVPPTGDPVLVTRLIERTNVDGFAWLDDAVAYADTDDPLAVTAETLADLGLARGRVGVERSGWFLSLDRYRQLGTLLTGAELVDGSGVIEQERAVKSPAEVARIREAAAIADQGVRAAVEASRAGRTEQAVAAHVHRVMIEQGGEYAGLPLFIASGHRTLLVHATWTDKILEPGDNVLLELAGTVARYAAPIFRTLSIGRPSEKLAQSSAVAVEMLEAVIDAIRPGISAHDVDAAAKRAAARVGMDRGVKKRAGYSVGLNFPPDWGEGHFLELREGDRTMLRPGMVFHVPQTCRVDGYPPAAVSETVLVTETGHDVLTRFRRELLVV
jgi:Xaa-Pro aminopeptidase